jgi:hypothetical protein
MLRNGRYSAWFRTRQEEGTGVMQGEGTGVIELNDGKVTGGDTVIKCSRSEHVKIMCSNYPPVIEASDLI